MGTKRPTTRTHRATNRKPHITAKMRRERSERLARLAELFPIARAASEPLGRFLFLDLGLPDTGIWIDRTFDELSEACEIYSYCNDLNYDPHPPPRMVVDLDSAKLAVTAVSYSIAVGIALEESFELEVGRDETYELAPGEHWAEAYWLAPRVNPAYTPMERTEKLREWIECEWRDSWDDED